MTAPSTDVYMLFSQRSRKDNIIFIENKMRSCNWDPENFSTYPGIKTNVNIQEIVRGYLNKPQILENKAEASQQELAGLASEDQALNKDVSGSVAKVKE